MDLNNHLFTSSDWNEVFRFYAQFNCASELLTWGETRPKGKATIYEVPGDTGIIVVIPTANQAGRYAEHLREIFKGQHLIFVESGGKEDIYFNYSVNCNIGIKCALDLNPDWIIISNDDMYKIDDFRLLRESLDKACGADIAWINPEPDYCHSSLFNLVRRNQLTFVQEVFRKNSSEYLAEFEKYSRRFKINYEINDYRESLPKKLFHKMVFNYVGSAMAGVDFTVLSRRCVQHLTANNRQVFDELFINGSEDFHLGLRLKEFKPVYSTFRIGSIGGGTLTQDRSRLAREIYNRVVFDSKIARMPSSLLG